MEVKIVSLPEGEDPDSFINKHGKDDFDELIKKAENFLEYETRYYDSLGKFDDPATAANMRVRNSKVNTRKAESGHPRTNLPPEARQDMWEYIENWNINTTYQEHDNCHQQTLHWGATKKCFKKA